MLTMLHLSSQLAALVCSDGSDVDVASCVKANNNNISWVKRCGILSLLLLCLLRRNYMVDEVWAKQEGMITKEQRG